MKAKQPKNIFRFITERKKVLRSNYKIIGVLGVLFFLIFFEGCKSIEKKTEIAPNIVFIVADDMGPWTLSVNNDPNTYTPELDKLAESGAVFRNCFASSAVCSPARASLITGRYPSETGITDYIPEGDSSGVNLSLKMFSEVFQNAGYSTAMVGKWHLGEHNLKFLPVKRGYDYFTGFPRGGMQSMSPRIQVEGNWETADGAYTPDLLTDYAINYIKELNPTKTGKPLLLSLHYWAPHANTDFPEGMEPTYEGRSWLPMQDIDLERWKDYNIILPEPDFPDLDTPLTVRMACEYYSSVHSVDRNVGRLMNILNELNLEENTIVIFTSDHGYNMGHNGLWHKGNGRWLTKNGTDPSGIYGTSRPNLYDNSIRVPCIIRWPGEISKSMKIDETVSFPDFFPTLLEMASIEKPESLLWRGESILPLLRNENIEWNNDLYAEYIDLRTYRTNEWKIVLDFSESKLHEMYNLVSDPKEHKNLFNSKEPDVLSNRIILRKKLLNIMNEINDPLLEKGHLNFND